MTIPHIDLQIEYLTAIKEGKQMEWRWKERNDRWSGWYKAPRPSWKEDLEYEIREVPRQQYIPECDVPRALEVEPKDGTEYWTIDPSYFPPVRRGIYYKDSISCRMRFNNRWCFATESDARAAWDAMTARRER